MSMPAPDAATFLELIRIAGPDALRYAQSQFTHDLNTLTDGDWQFSAWLSAKGRVLAFFPLQRIGAEELRLAVPAALSEALLPRLRMFVLRSKLTVEALGAPAARLSGPADPDAIALADGRSLCMRPASPDAGSIDETQWRLADIRAGLPRIVPENQDQFLLHALELDRLPAVSLRKGCYPGQEIVARTHYLGRSKRRLAHLCGDGSPPAEHSSLRHGEQNLGELVDVVPCGQGWEALASVREEAFDLAPEGLSVDTRPLAKMRELGAASPSTA